MSKPTIVLVHGAFGDASSWRSVFDHLDGDEYTMRAGVMAPPTLYDLPPQQAGLMALDALAEPLEVSLRSLLWCVALMLGVVELCVQAAGAV